ncbi:hypothetical protein P7H15_14780 [Paenibacillus larvae]|nr:hypothetical protein [Paenibacillus larvae]MDT2293836.1 hypothetical protein [Paenibacillus larvae]
MENVGKKAAEIRITHANVSPIRRLWYQAIQELHAEKGYAVTKLCKLAGVARSAYYKWLKMETIHQGT